MVSHHQISMDSLVGMGSRHHHLKATVSHKVTSNRQVAMELLLMVNHMVMVLLANSLVYVDYIYCNLLFGLSIKMIFVTIFAVQSINQSIKSFNFSRA